MLAQTFSMSMGLYDARVGCLSFVLSDGTLKEKLVPRLERMAVSAWLSPPSLGARVAER